jgi:kynurenine 3-monooxygenase
MKEQISICGAGLVGSLVSIFLVEQGYTVRVFEKRRDPRMHADDAGRSINLAISHRGLHALKEAFANLDIEALKISVPMFGRAIHDALGAVTFQSYGEATQHINSISRGELNILLISKAEQLGVQFLFSHTCVEYNRVQKKWVFENQHKELIATEESEIMIGADGTFSVIRKNLLTAINKQAHISTLDYGYKELEIYPTEGARINLKEALPIWPRERFMLIALPNTNGSYTATLFLPMEGEQSFEVLKSEEHIIEFFETYFVDAMQLIPYVVEQFKAHPTSRLSTIHTDDWFNDHTVLIGDAAHALVPFYGQGMNAGFEDCRVLSEILKSKEMSTTWEEIFKTFFLERKINCDAISDLALQNFVEMRDDVADAGFIIRKKVEKFLHHKLNNAFIPQYTLVSFSDTPYSAAKAIGVLHASILNEIMLLPQIVELWPSQTLESEVLRIAAKYI